MKTYLKCTGPLLFAFAGALLTTPVASAIAQSASEQSSVSISSGATLNEPAGAQATIGFQGNTRFEHGSQLIGMSIVDTSHQNLGQVTDALYDLQSGRL